MTTPVRISLDQLLDRNWWQHRDEAWTCQLGGHEFDAALAALTAEYHEADGPETALEHARWCLELNLAADRLDVWDFDYYLLILWQTAPGTVWCRTQVPGWGVAPGRR